MGEKNKIEEMEISESFYLLRKREGENAERSLHKELKTAVKRIRKYMSEGTTYSDIELLRISDEEKLKAEQVLWGEIMMFSMREESKEAKEGE